MATRKKTIHIPGTTAHQTYRLKDGTKVPGGSTIAKLCGANESSFFLMRWANQLGLDGYDSDKYRDKLADVGTLCHARALQFFSGKPIREFDCEFSQWIIEKADICWTKFEEWTVGKEFVPKVVEQPVVSEKWRFGGTPDFYGLIKGLTGPGIDPGIFYRILIDWKTSKYIYKSHRYQVAGYDVALMENGYESDRLSILRMGRDPEEGFEFRHWSVEEMILPWAIFKTGLEMHALQKLEPRNF